METSPDWAALTCFCVKKNICKLYIVIVRVLDQILARQAWTNPEAFLEFIQ